MLTVGVDLGGTKIFGALVNPEGEIIGDARIATPTTGDGLVDGIAQLVADLGGGGADPVVGVGVGAAGMIAMDGAVTYGPNVVAFRSGFPLRSRLEDRIGLPVAVDNDANAAAWGEVVHGAGVGSADALVVTLGTGIGGGIIAGGRPYRGAHGYAAEIGHFQVVENGPMCACGVPGHWEAMASGPALHRMTREAVARGALPDSVDTAEHVSQEALAGDGAALAVLTEYADWVAVGFAALTNILDPAVIVVGGGLAELGETLLSRVRASFWKLVEAPSHREPVDVVLASLGGRAGAIGAAAMARERATEAR